MKVIDLVLDVPQTTGDVSKTYEVGNGSVNSLLIQIIGSGSDATYSIEGSLDGKTWVDITNAFFNLGTGVELAAPVATGIVVWNSFGPPPKYFHVKCAAQGTKAASSIIATYQDTHSF